MSTDTQSVLTTKEVLLDEIVRETGIPKEEIIKISKELKLKHPGMRIHAISVPYSGLFFMRPQLLKDVKESTKMVNEYIDAKISEYGGASELEQHPQKAKITRDIDMEASDISNESALKNCVLYPYEFGERLLRGEVETGVVPSLLENLLEISSWGQVTITEI